MKLPTISRVSFGQGLFDIWTNSINTVYNTCCDTYHAPDSELTTVCSSWRWTTLSVPRRFQTSPWDATMRHLTQRRNGAPGPVANLSRAAPRSWRANPVVPNSDREGTPLYWLSESHCKIRWVLSQSCMIFVVFSMLCLRLQVFRWYLYILYLLFLGSQFLLHHWASH